MLKICLCVLGLSVSVFASTTTWTGAEDNRLNNAANWTDGVPSKGDVATFDGTDSGPLSLIYDGVVGGTTGIQLKFAEGQADDVSIQSSSSWIRLIHTNPAILVESGAGGVSFGNGGGSGLIGLGSGTTDRTYFMNNLSTNEVHFGPEFTWVYGGIHNATIRFINGDWRIDGPLDETGDRTITVAVANHPGTVKLYGNNSEFSGGVNLINGTLSITNASNLGTGTLNIAPSQSSHTAALSVGTNDFTIITNAVTFGSVSGATNSIGLNSTGSIVFENDVNWGAGAKSYRIDTDVTFVGRFLGETANIQSLFGSNLDTSVARMYEGGGAAALGGKNFQIGNNLQVICYHNNSLGSVSDQPFTLLGAHRNSRIELKNDIDLARELTVQGRNNESIMIASSSGTNSASAVLTGTADLDEFNFEAQAGSNLNLHILSTVTNNRMTKFGDGTLWLSGENAFNAITVRAGSLMLGSTQNNASWGVWVWEGANIGGNGSISHDLHMGHNAGFLFNSNFLLTVNGRVHFDSPFGVRNIHGIPDDIPPGTYTLMEGDIDFSMVHNIGPERAVRISNNRKAYFQKGSIQLVIIEDELLYTVDNNEVTITGYSGTGSVLVVPSEIDGNPVVAVATEAFDGNTTLEHVEFQSESITLGPRVFRDSAVKSVIVGSSDLPNGLFRDATELEWVMLRGNAPTTGLNVFLGIDPLPRILYHKGTEGWDSAFTDHDKKRWDLFVTEERLGAGVSIGHMMDFAGTPEQYFYWKPKYAQMLKDWGFDHVRLPIAWEREGWLDLETGEVSEEAFSYVDSVIRDILGTGMSVIMNVHDGYDGDTPLINDEVFKTMWGHLSSFASQYPSDRVVLELRNEPRAWFAVVENPDARYQTVSQANRVDPTPDFSDALWAKDEEFNGAMSYKTSTGGTDYFLWFNDPVGAEAWYISTDKGALGSGWFHSASEAGGLPSDTAYFASGEWSGSLELFEYIPAIRWNVLVEQTVPIVRAHSPDKLIAVGIAPRGTPPGISLLDLPEDHALILDVHIYEPFEFTHQGADWVPGSSGWLGNKWFGSYYERVYIEDELYFVKEFAIENDVPVTIGEFGVISHADYLSRLRFIEYIVKFANKYNWSFSFWSFDYRPEFSFGFYHTEHDVVQYDNYIRILTSHNINVPYWYNQYRTPLYESDWTSNVDGWQLNVNMPSGAQANHSVSNDEYIVEVTGVGTAAWHVNIQRYIDAPLTQGKYYIMEVIARSPDKKDLNGYIQAGSPGYDPFSRHNTYITYEDSTKYIWKFLVNRESSEDISIIFNMGTSTGSIIFESIKLYEIDYEPNRFEVLFH